MTKRHQIQACLIKILKNPNFEIIIANSVSRLSRPTKPVKKIERKKNPADALFDDMFGTSSGYGTESTNSTAKDRGLPPLPGDEEDAEGDLFGMAADFMREKELFDADEKAQAGQNLLSFVDEKPKLYGDEMFSPRSDRSMGGLQRGKGSALMDFFVDPTQIFASERHPALQEVLAVLSKSKKHRGIS